jgi:lysine 2,3-aminomutase
MTEKTLRSAQELVAAGFVEPARLAELEAVAKRYAIAITPAMAGLIDGADAADPVARQFLPDARELEAAAAERTDPIGDEAHSPVAGIVHRYPDRVLLKLTGVCAVYCRFCFRREAVGPGQATMLPPDALRAALDYIAGRREVWEVIVTGGDPLVLAPRRLAGITAAIARIAHVKVLRWHSRVPVVAPERITRDLVAAVRSPAQTVWLAVHANHPRELGPAARAALARIADAGIPMVSQTVLLRGVNDDAATLEALMRAFVEARVKPYYLHHADLAPGTSHLRTTIAAGQALTARLRGRVSGLCQPAYVLDIPGGYGKAPIGPASLRPVADGGGRHYRVCDFTGGEHSYMDEVRREEDGS